MVRCWVLVPWAVDHRAEPGRGWWVVEVICSAAALAFLVAEFVVLWSEEL